ncbi:MAG TPA: glycosyl hydrolase [Steroidobacteraceae bacterium]|nr:glycosyl hydrolase [Steroidobacteraceae bacterium]
MPLPRLIRITCLLVTLACCAPSSAAVESPPWLPVSQDPPVDVRPKVRSRPSEQNLAALADSGFGSVELGVDFHAAPEIARAELEALLATARRAGVSIDLAPGGGQPYASPGIAEADSMQQLSSEAVSVQGKQDFIATLRQPAALAGHATLVAVTAARVADASTVPVLLDVTSAFDLTQQMDKGGALHWHVPAGQWMLFTFWQRATGQVMLGKPFEPPSVWSGREPQLAHGTFYTADIFSGAGIASALAYLDQHILPADVTALRGANFAHDSLEVQANMFWTGDLPREFKQRRGYSLIPYLPVLFTPKGASFDPLDPAWGGPLPARPFDFAGDVGARVRYDYQQTLTDLYAERYLGTLSSWAHTKGMSSRVQVAYNYFALDMLRSARAVDVPENESFDSGWSKPFDASIPSPGSNRWRHAMDAYRLTGSATHLAEQRRATVEFGDDFAIYAKQPADYMQQLNEALAGGITMGLLTAFQSADESWPVPKGLSFIGLGDEWTAGWPQWRDWRALARYFSRSTQVLEFGEPRVDLAIYHDKGLATVHDDVPLYGDGGLDAAGYTYDFIDPAALSLPNASRVPAQLFGTGYRAIILDHQATLPVPALEALLLSARSGLRILIIGAPPGKSPGFLQHAAHDRRIVEGMTALLKLPTVVHISDSAQAAAALRALHCEPAASFGGAPLLSVHRHSQDQDIWWIFNPTAARVTARASLQAAGVPYQVDLWSGAATRMAEWTSTTDTTSARLSVAPHASIVLIVRHSETAPLHVVSSSADTLLTDRGDVVVGDARGGLQRLQLSDGETLEVDLAPLAAPLALTRWHLHVDEMLPTGLKPHDIGAASLGDWREIPELKYAVGQALYTTTVPLSADWFAANRDQQLSLGEVAGAVQVTVNDHLISEQSVGNGAWLVGTLLKPGSNTIAIRLDTTLLNRMVQLRDSGDPRYQTGPTPLAGAPSGVIGPVTISNVLRVPLVGR